jgi:hypothetical protein
VLTKRAGYGNGRSKEGSGKTVAGFFFIKVFGLVFPNVIAKR